MTQTFEQPRVVLLDGIFKFSQEVGKGFLHTLDVDRLIAPCYEAASLTPKKPRYGGWEATQSPGIDRSLAVRGSSDGGSDGG